jgi:cytochrome c-type biogenesis protein CcmH/NrfG
VAGSDLPQAEQTCEELLAKAQEVDPGNTEALQALASVRMSQSRPDDAKQCLEQAWALWKDLDPGAPSHLSLDVSHAAL